MDISQENCDEDLDSLSKDIPVLSEYAKGLETHVKRRYLQKISQVGVDPASIPSDQFDPELSNNYLTCLFNDSYSQLSLIRKHTSN